LNVTISSPNNPPNTPSNPNPEDGATDVDINTDLSWNCSDPNGDPVTYNVYFEADDPTPDELVSENQSDTSYDPGTMEFGNTYYWKIVAWDNHDASTIGPIWSFTTEYNNPPNTPSNPDPYDGEIGVDVDHDLSWTGGDPDPGDTVTYDIYFEADDSTPDVMVSNNQSGTTYDPGSMDGNTHYYWQIVAWDNHGAYSEGPIWDFTTENNPPNTPSNPDPDDGETDVDVDHDLSWVGGDPDPGDTVTYDVYFEADDPTPDVMVSDDQTETTFDPDTLDYETIYYWKIVAKDSHSATTEGPIWHFTTEETPAPDLDCSGTLGWTGVPPGSTVTGSFTVENIGDPESLLDWEVESYPEWGAWTFDAENGEDLTPEDDPITVNVEVVAPNQQNQQFNGEVKIVNSENSNDYCIIAVSLATPVNLQLTSSQSINLHTKSSKNPYQSTQILSDNSKLTSCTTILIQSNSR